MNNASCREHFDQAQAGLQDFTFLFIGMVIKAARNNEELACTYVRQKYTKCM